MGMNVAAADDAGSWIDFPALTKSKTKYNTARAKFFAGDFQLV